MRNDSLAWLLLVDPVMEGKLQPQKEDNPAKKKTSQATGATPRNPRASETGGVRGVGGQKGFKLRCDSN